MSLTSFLQIPEIKDRFRTDFKKPAVTRKMILHAPPLTNNYSLVGSAFDYLMRFSIEYHNPLAKKSDIWLAETSLKMLEAWTKKGLMKQGHYYSIQRIVNTARDRHHTYLHDGKITDELIGSAIQLARLDMVYRIGLLSEYIDSIRGEDVQDLKKMMTLIPQENFQAKEICILNPTFGIASRIVGGADADLIIDDTLIEIKTTINPKFERDFFNQLIGYVILKRICEMNILVAPSNDESEDTRLLNEDTFDFSSSSDLKINKIGVYFSRYGMLQTVDIRSITNHGEFTSEFIDWFLDRCNVPSIDAECLISHIRN